MKLVIEVNRDKNMKTRSVLVLALVISALQDF